MAICELPRVHHAFFVDDEHELFVHDIERRLLGNEQSVLQRRRQQNLAGLAVAQQSIGIRERRAERNGAGLVVEIRFDGLDLAGVLANSFPLAMTSFTSDAAPPSARDL